MSIDLAKELIRFFRDDIGGNRITGKNGEVLYEDESSSFVSKEKTNWRIACPLPRPGQRGEQWELLRTDAGKNYMVITSTVAEGEEIIQLHHMVDTSLYVDLFQDISEYSRMLKEEKERDGLTGLYNKGKFLSLKQTLFKGQDSIAVFNLDVNFLKQMNDEYGHDAGDRLLCKAADSLRLIEARNVLPFRVGGDEFLVVAIHVSLEEAEMIQRRWEKGLEGLNRKRDGIHCDMACGMAYGEKGYNLEEILALADKLMYEGKVAKKAGR